MILRRRFELEMLRELQQAVRLDHLPVERPRRGWGFVAMAGVGFLLLLVQASLTW